MKSATHSWFGAVAVKSPVDQIAGPGVALGGDRGAELLAAQRPGPALGCHQPLDGAPGHVVALCAQMQPHLAGTEPDPEPVRPGRGDQRRAPRRRAAPASRAPRDVPRSRWSGRSCSPCSVSTLQIGSTPNTSRCSSMKSTRTCVGGRAPPRRKPTPTSGSRSPAAARRLSFFSSRISAMLLARLARPDDRRRSRPGGPTCAASPASRSRASPRSSGSPRTRCGTHAFDLHHQPDRALPQLTGYLEGRAMDFILQRMKSPDIPGRFSSLVELSMVVVAVGVGLRWRPDPFRSASGRSARDPVVAVQTGCEKLSTSSLILSKLSVPTPRVSSWTPPSPSLLPR